MRAAAAAIVALTTFSFISTAFAGSKELTAGELMSFCESKDTVAETACRFYILGAVQGVSFGDGAIMIGGQATERRKTHFCIEDTPQSALVETFVRTIKRVLLKYPDDAKLPAVSTVDAAMHSSYPCPLGQK